MTKKETIMQLTQFLDSLGSSFNFFCSPAQAQANSFSSPEIMNFVPIIFVFILMYFLILRPQTKKAKQHRDMIEALRRGDRVLTAGGIIGTVTKIENGPEVQIEIAENVRVRIVKATLVQVLAKTEPFKNSNVIENTSEETLPTQFSADPMSPKKKPSSKVSSLPRKTSKSKENL